MSHFCCNIRRWGLAGVLALVGTTVAQADGDSPGFALSGFGTLGAVTSSNHNVDFVTAETQPNGAGYTRNIAFGPDSRFGLQADGHWDDFSAVLQVVSQQQPNGTYTPHIEWANLKYQVNPDWHVGVGRVALPVLMDSDYRLVGFANTTVRPPIEAYSIIPATSITGAYTSWRTHTGSVNNTLQALYGTFISAFPFNGSIRVPHAWGVADNVDTGPFIVRASYSSASVVWHAPQTDALLNALNEFGTQVAAIPPLAPVGAQALALNQYRVDGQWTHIISFGASYDKESWLVMGEWVKMSRVGFIPMNQAEYLTIGYRVGPFTPYVSVAGLHTTVVRPTPISTQELPPPLAIAAGQLNEGLQGLTLSQDFSENSGSVGLRWDVRSNVDVKLQYDNIHAHSASGEFVHVTAPGLLGAGVNVVSVTLDFVF